MQEARPGQCNGQHIAEFGLVSLSNARQLPLLGQVSCDIPNRCAQRVCPSCRRAPSDDELTVPPAARMRVRSSGRAGE